MENVISVEVQEQVKGVLAEASRFDNYIVETPEQLKVAEIDVKSITAQIKLIEAERVKMKKPALETCQNIDNFFNPPKKKLETLKAGVQAAGKSYKLKEGQKRIEQERKLQEQARLEELRQKKELEERAKKWEEKGQADKAEGLRGQAEEVFMPTPVIEKVETKIDNRLFKFTWKAKVTDFNALPNEYKIPNQTALDGLARATKGSMKIAGVEFYKD